MSFQQPSHYPQQPNTYYPPQQPMMSPPPPSRKKRSPWLIIGIVVGVLLLFAAIGTALTKSPPSTQATPTIVATSTPVATDTPEPTNTPPSANLHYNVGVPASTLDGYVVTVNKTYTSAGGEFDTPSKGNQYLVVDVSVKNNTGHTQHMASIQFTLTDSTGQTIDDTIATLSNVHPYVGGTLQDGSTMRGQLVYEVPTGKHPYSLAFAANSFSDNQTIWDITS